MISKMCENGWCCITARSLFSLFHSDSRSPRRVWPIAAAVEAATNDRTGNSPISRRVILPPPPPPLPPPPPQPQPPGAHVNSNITRESSVGDVATWLDRLPLNEASKRYIMDIVRLAPIDGALFCQRIRSAADFESRIGSQIADRRSCDAQQCIVAPLIPIFHKFSY